MRGVEGARGRTQGKGRGGEVVGRVGAHEARSRGGVAAVLPPQPCHCTEGLTPHCYASAPHTATQRCHAGTRSRRGGSRALSRSRSRSRARARARSRSRSRAQARSRSGAASAHEGEWGGRSRALRRERACGEARGGARSAYACAHTTPLPHYGTAAVGGATEVEGMIEAGRRGRGRGHGRGRGSGVESAHEVSGGRARAQRRGRACGEA